ncbi:MAG: phosphoribosyltransferase family protein [Bacteroidia bacterium]|nr:phosphoribosyltransferase family protein [Bacteroidia bacterium]MDW8089258.1 phosphoribosyltransferase family protein [Bacteroidia bacterium]
MDLRGYACFLRSSGIAQLRTSPPWFVWSSGQQSPIYLDHRRLLGYPTWRRWVVEELHRLILQQGVEPRGVVGVATGGIPWAAWLGERLGLPVGYVRPQPKPHGYGQQVEGLRPSAAPVLIVEDVLSTGQSLHRATQALAQSGYAVGAAFVLWSYELPQLPSFSFPLYRLLTFPQALLFWEMEGLITQQDKAMLLSWIRGGPSGKLG